MFSATSRLRTYRQHRDLVDVCSAADLEGDLPGRGAVRRILKSGVRVHDDDVIIGRAHDDDVIIGMVHDDDVVVVRRREASAGSGPLVRFRRQEGVDRPELSVDLTEEDTRSLLTHQHTTLFLNTSSFRRLERKSPFSSLFYCSLSVCVSSPVQLTRSLSPAQCCRKYGYFFSTSNQS